MAAISCIVAALSVLSWNCQVSAQVVASLDIQSSAPLFGPVRNDWLGVNVDTASYNHMIDLSDKYLRNLFKNVARSSPSSPLRHRVGGSAANGIQYCQSCSTWGDNGHGTTIINDELLMLLADFQNDTGVAIQWGVQYIPGDLGNFATLLEAVHQHGLNISGWSLGNELIGSSSFNSTQYAVDYHAFRALIRSFPGIGQAIAGPSAAGFPGPEALSPFYSLVTQQGDVDELSFHAYSFKNCSLAVYTNLTAIEHISTYYTSYTAFKSSIPSAEATPLLLEEMATQAGGGCLTLSSSYVSGFWYVHALGLAGAAGIGRVTRQDLVGWSFDNGLSYYPLAGPPGWTNSSQYGGPPLPHPDYFTTLLWRQIMGKAVLNVSIIPAVDSFAVHGWCHPSLPGAVSLAYVNLANQAVTVQANVTMVPRQEFILTAYPGAGSGGISPSDNPPAYLLNDAVYLNGGASPLYLNPDGTLPGGSIQGATVEDPGQPLTVPAYSYGFVVLVDADSPVCQ